MCGRSAHRGEQQPDGRQLPLHVERWPTL